MHHDFYAIALKDEKFAILDTLDNSVEYYSAEEIKSFLKQGIIINGVVTPDEPITYSYKGLKVNLAYPKHKRFGKWTVCIREVGDRYGLSLQSVTNVRTVSFYCEARNFTKPEYPFGQHVSDYTYDTIKNHQGMLRLDYSVFEWSIDEVTMRKIKNWLRTDT